MPEQQLKIAVLGSGSWGTALAILLSRNGAEISLWGHLESEIEALIADRENKTYIPGIPFPDGITPTTDMATAVKGADEVLVVVPSHAFRQVMHNLALLLDSDTSVSWATKGLEPQSGKLLHEVAREELGERPIAVISGPSFAKEVAKGLPTAVTVASSSAAHAERLAEYLHSECFRAYTSDDIIGLEVGGAAKNLMAIAAGIADGLGFGANTRAALITRGLAEIMRLGHALGAKPETFMGLGGLGDLTLTCTDNQSRNRRMGLALARGLSVEEARAEIGQEVEGVMTAREVHNRALELGIDMPLSEQTYLVLYEGLDPKTAVHNLMVRRQKPETD
ncbi:NAD(P)H-dependent glycerol-3-phosphate dehydrogenase [Solemya velesiana gill symbiont]|uniref:Glycerol-3-phosphate dehydrogenase [NAD(P)+] n=1 Tax=Solemya velesiana gill symbiont TaxID=1918948 RepID=A0A1T2KWF0_9GAMM|nr:NAD(P)H-dependent glycerol-3-phosphate dehydrogenase [Solemya velesiana gill symbiont]OOZ37173.1 glycerol-3-phosphate dehydrogenase [Solemya velesiana gill symbiont]